MANAAISDTLGVDNAQVLLDTGNNTAMSATVTGTFVGTITFQVIYDAVEGWVSAPCFTRAGVGATSTLTAPGSRFINVACALSVRALMHPFTSGIAEVTFADSPAISVAAASGGGGGGAATIAEGADVTEGTTTDTAVTGDNAGTVNAHLRGLTKVSGDPTDTGIITDANGTANGYLRGAIKMWITFLSRIPAALVNGAFVIGGDVASGTNDAGNPIKQGFLSISHGSTPTSVATAQRVNALATRSGVQFMAAGHPNTISHSVNYTGAQTNTVVIANSAGTKLVVTSILVQASAANSGNIAIGVGLAQTVTPPSATAGRLGGSVAIAPGGGFGRKTYQAGADGDQLLTTSVGSGDYAVTVEYHTTPT